MTLIKNCVYRTQIGVGSELEGGGNGEKSLEGWGVLLWSSRNVLKPDRDGGCTTLWLY